MSTIFLSLSAKFHFDSSEYNKIRKNFESFRDIRNEIRNYQNHGAIFELKLKFRWSYDMCLDKRKGVLLFSTTNHRFILN